MEGRKKHHRRRDPWRDAGRQDRRRAGAGAAKPAPILFQEEQQNALSNKIDQAGVAALLARHRAGVKDATRQLFSGFRWLVYKFANRNQRESRQDELGYLFAELTSSIEKLKPSPPGARGKRRTVGPQLNTSGAVENFIWSNLTRAALEHRREESTNILPNRSTNSKRRKAGRDPYPTIERAF